MESYDCIIIGTGSAMEIASAVLSTNEHAKIAVVDKDQAGGICLTRGCIPSKLLVYPAEVVRMVQRAGEFGIQSQILSIDFPAIMRRMHHYVDRDSEMVREGLTSSPNIDYYHDAAEFTSPYTLNVANETIYSKTIILGIGSKPFVPLIEGLTSVPYYTSDTILTLDHLPESIIIIGAGFIAAEYGHFFSSMGSRVTIIGRNPRFLPGEEPEISRLAERVLGEHVHILTNHEAVRFEKGLGDSVSVTSSDRSTHEEAKSVADVVMVATGRAPNTDILHPERSGIATTTKGWVVVNEYLETSQPGIWALGDADGKFLFKHKANYEAAIVYRNAVLGKRQPVDYSAVPHAVFSDPEIASVGMLESEATEKFSSDKLLIGFYRYEDTAKGLAMGARDSFVKVIVENETFRLLGAHIVGPQSSTLIQECVNLLANESPIIFGITRPMHIHPALPEVVQKAFTNLMSPEEYHHLIEGT